MAKLVDAPGLGSSVSSFGPSVKSPIKSTSYCKFAKKSTVYKFGIPAFALILSHPISLKFTVFQEVSLGRVWEGWRLRLGKVGHQAPS